MRRPSTNWVDRTLEFLSPQLGLRREHARLAHALLQRHYEAASSGRRTQNWYRTGTDANTAVASSLGTLRNIARDLVRNNPYAEAAVKAIANNTVGLGIVAAQRHDRWQEWSQSTACDADGRHNLAGLQKLVMRTVAESGEALIRRRPRRLEDGLPLPLQLQILEPDFLDSTKDAAALPNGGKIVQGVEFDPLGRRAAYHLFRSHPGSSFSLTSTSFTGASSRVPASEVRHVFESRRTGQVRAATWFAPVLLKFKDFDEYDDATLIKQKIAACLAVITSDVDGSAPAVGTADDTHTPGLDSLEPGMILNVPPGRTVSVVTPPAVADYGPYSKGQLRAIATGLHVTYEELTGDYSEVNFSSARMARLRNWSHVEDWRWLMLVPQFLDPVWQWAMEASEIMGLAVSPSTQWTAPPLPMIEPDKEGLAIQRNIRTGITTLSEEIRARGYNRDQFLDEMQKDFEDLDRRGLILDSDPRKMTQAGQFQSTTPKPEAPPAPKSADTADDAEDGNEKEDEADT